LNPFITHRGTNGYSCCNSEMVICHNVSRAAAIAAVVATFDLPLEEIEAAIDNPADVATFRTTLQAATQSTLSAVESELSDLAESNELNRLRSQITLVHSAVADLVAAIEEENRYQAEANQIARDQERRIAEQQAAQEAERAALRKAQQQERAAIAAAERERLRRSKKLVTWLDGSADFLDVTVKPHKVLRKFKPGEVIPEEYLDYA
jgi:hypothetical protein